MTHLAGLSSAERDDDVELLYEPLFTDHAPHGPEDVFSGSDVDALVDALTAVRATARPTGGVA